MNLTNLTPWQNDKQFADGYYNAIRQVVHKVSGKLVTVQIAPEQEDKENATDYVVTLDAGKIACRVRRPNCVFRDLTIRSWRSSGAKTELEKIKEGFAKWYLYAWAKDANNFDSWILVDLDKLRKSRLLEKEHREVSNVDGQSRFIPINLSDLIMNDCIIAEGEMKK
jgi:hypothetical protein